MKRIVKPEVGITASTDSAYMNYKVVAWDDTYEQDLHYFSTYVEALQYGDRVFNGCCNIIEL